MATCPNKGLREWQDLVNSVGENRAYFLWDKFKGMVPRNFYTQLSIGTLDKVNVFLENVGVDVVLKEDLTDNEGNIILSSSNFINNTIEILNSDERAEAWSSLPKEAAKFWYSRLFESDLKDELRSYVQKNEPDYQNKLKELLRQGKNRQLAEIELIGNHISEEIVKLDTEVKKSLWKKIVDFFRSWIGNYKEAIKVKEGSPVTTAVERILNSDISDLLSLEEIEALEEAYKPETFVTTENKEEVGEIHDSAWKEYIFRKFKPKSRYLKKTIEKFQNSYNMDSYSPSPWEGIVGHDAQKFEGKITLTLKSPPENTDLSNYHAVTPGLRGFKELRKKFAKNPIPLSGKIKLNTTKNELKIFNLVKDLIAEENPTLRSIPIDEFAEEVQIFLGANYLLAFKEETKHLDYRIIPSFDDPTTRHRKISIRFNHKNVNDALVRSAHFKGYPTAFGSITYFKSDIARTAPDKVIIHELQSDFIERFIQTLSTLKEKSNQLLEKEIEENEDKVLSLPEFKRKTLDKFKRSTDPFSILSQHLRLPGEKLMPKYSIDRINSMQSYQVLDDTGEVTERGVTYTGEKAVNEHLKRHLTSVFSLRLQEQLDLNSGADVTNIQSRIDASFHSINIYREFNERFVSSKSGSTSSRKNHLNKLFKNVDKALKRATEYVESFEVSETQGNLVGMNVMDVGFALGSSANMEIIKEVSPFFYKDNALEEHNMYQFNNNVNYALHKAVLSAINLKSKTGRVMTESQILFFIGKHFSKRAGEETSSLSREIHDGRKQLSSYLFYTRLSELSEDEKLKLLKEHYESNKDYAKITEELAEKQVEEHYENYKDRRKVALRGYDKPIIELKTEEELVQFREDVEKQLLYFTPLSTHLINTITKEKGKDFPIYFSGHDATYNLQYNSITASIYAGPEEVSISPEFGSKEELKKEAEKRVRTRGGDYFDTRSRKEQNESIRIEALRMNGQRPYEVGPVYAAFSKIPGVSLEYVSSIKGMKDVGGYRVNIENYEGTDGPLLQKTELPASKASEETLEKVKEAAKKMGISITDLASYLKGNPDVNTSSINGLADLIKGVVAIAQGREDIALTEEIVHVATAILEQTNPSLVQEMISKIGNYEIYKKVLETYKDDKNYQLPNGKPNIRKIKKEAVDKLIAELILLQNEGSTEFPELLQEVNRSLWHTLWRKVLNFINSLFEKSNVNIFEETAQKIMNEDIGTVDVIESDEIFLQVSDAQKTFQQRIKETKNVIKNVEREEEEVDPIFLDTEKANNWYELINEPGEALSRVTDRVKAWYRSKFGDKDFSEAQKEINEFKRDRGTLYHQYFEEIHTRYFNPDGTKRTKVLARRPISDNNDRNIYVKLEKHFTQLVAFHAKDGKQNLVFSEIMVYDPKNKEAGTIDLVIVEPSGKVHIYDWKFMSIADGAKDVAWFKQGAYNIQLETYKDILQKYYGADTIGKNRAVPILLDVRTKPKSPFSLAGKKEYFIQDIEIGHVDSSKIESLKLLPVSAKSESTEIEEIDDLLDQLNAVHSKISSLKVNSDEEKEFKKQRLNIIKEATRIIQGTLNVEPLVDVISIMKKEGDTILSDYEMLYRDVSHKNNSFTEKQLSEFAETLQDYMAIGEVFGSIGDAITKIFYKKGDEKFAVTEKQKENVNYRKQLAEKIQEESQDIRLNTIEVKKIAKLFADEFIGRRNLVNGLLSLSREIKSIGSIFRGISDLGYAATDVLYRVVNNSKSLASRQAFSQVERLNKIRKKIVSRGGNTRALLNKLYQKDKDGKKINKLIYKYDRRFYQTLDNLAQDGDRSTKTLKMYIDVDGYTKEAGEMLKKRIHHIQRSYIEPDLIERLIEEERKKYDINNVNFNGYSNYILKRHPKEDWISEEYKEIRKDDDLFELYNFITETNERANEAGYIENQVRSSFLPFIRKSFAESLAWDFSLAAVTRLGDTLSIRPDDVGYGSVDALTKEVVNTIPKYYTSDFTIQEDGTKDMTEVSEDLFKNLSLYVTHLERYKYLSDVEGQLTLIRKVESMKNSYESTITGKIAMKGNKPQEIAGNKTNTELYTNFLNALLYGQKYPISTTDIGLGFGKAIEFGKNLITRVTGKKFKKNDNPNVTSLMKLIDKGNTYYALKTLGFSLVSGFATLFGTTIQINTQSGVYYKAREFAKNAMKLIGFKYNKSDEREMFVQLMNAFMPLKDDPNYEIIKEMGLSKLTQENYSDLIMVFMRSPELHVERTLFFTLLDNSMIDESGNIVNINEYVKAKYPNRYKSASEFRTSKKKIEAEIEELKNTKSINKTKKLVDGKVTIPGFDMNNLDQIQKLTNLTRRLARNATGSLADSDLNRISMNIWGRSAMVFKGWIPKLVDTRFGEFRKVGDDFSTEIGEDGLTTGEKFDIGRVRLLWYVLGTSIRDKTSNVINILSYNEKGVEAIDKMYEDYANKYVKRTGKELVFNPETGEYSNFISKAEFTDLIRTNIRNQLKELAMLATLIAVTVAVPPPEEDMSKSERNFYRFTQKVIDRFVSELSFFYNPAEFQRMLGGSAFPVIGILTDMKKFTFHTAMELSGIDITDPTKSKEDVMRDAHPVKYGAKMIPLAKELLNYGAITSDTFAEEFDIYIQNRNF